jgi:uncharacterized membrane protein
VSSFLQFIVDQDAAARAGTLLLDKVKSVMDQLPAGSRPKLYLYGESLGSLGSQDKFVGIDVDDFPEYFDGALWVGSPSASRLWSELHKEPSISEMVVFAYDDSAYTKANGASVIFVANPTDPVVWINKSLLVKKPQWLNHPSSSNVSPHMIWRPGLTFLQLAAELLKSSSQPSGVGHSYHDRILPAWREIIEL